MPDPASEPDGPDPKVRALVVLRVASPDFERWMAAVHASGCCAQPVRLSGKVLSVDPQSGQLELVYTTGVQPDRVLLKACGTRRATRCPACAAMYRGDAKTLLRAGLDGDDGDGDGETALSPLVFMTLTAPSFGAVHRATDPPRSCRPTATPPVCRHLRLQTCGQVHLRGEPPTGEALCPECYDYQSAVIFNARAGELWRRTLIAAQRQLAGRAAIPVRAFGAHWRISYAKVVEFQARGVVHLHAMVRLDQLDRGQGSELGGDDLAAALGAAAARAAAPNPLHPDRAIRWGAQTDIEIIDAGSRRKTVAYLAKYATKSVDGAGLLDRRLRSGNIDHLDLPDQLKTMAEVAWDLGGRPDLKGLNLRAWAHSLGWRGHWLTKSAHWSTTFANLRAGRRTWRLEQLGITPEEAAARWGEWDYQGSGYLNAGDAWLAANANRAAKLNRRTAWEET